MASSNKHWLSINEVHLGDCRELLPRIEPESVSLSVWSPPYWVGKSYETNLSFEDWQGLLSQTIRLHYDILKPGGFLAINIADILCFRDPDMPRIQLPNVSKHRSPITRDMVLEAVAKHPEYNRNQLAELLGCSEQTIDRRMHGNNIRGGKYGTQTRVKLVGGLVEQWATDAGLYLYDRRIWVKDPAWANGQWHSSSYRSVDEFEYIYVFWKPGETVIDRQRIEPKEWSKWGSRGVWTFRSVRANDEHEAKYPLELPLRLIRLLTEPSDTVLDCFMGSGTTALAAIQSDRNFIGCEMMPGYLELAKKNIAQLRLNGIQGTLTLACDHLEEPTP